MCCWNRDRTARRPRRFHLTTSAYGPATCSSLTPALLQTDDRDVGLWRLDAARGDCPGANVRACRRQLSSVAKHYKAGAIQSHVQMFPSVQPENFISVIDVVGFMMKLPPASQVDWVRGQHCPLREQPPVHYKVSEDPRVSARTYIVNSAKAACVRPQVQSSGPRLLLTHGRSRGRRDSTRSWSRWRCRCRTRTRWTAGLPTADTACPARPRRLRSPKAHQRRR
jgi:hypothetical protein